jgi:uncharacterized cupin superfamily protein
MQQISHPLAVKAAIRDATLSAWPIPADWIRSGQPDAAGMVLSKSDDSRIVRGIWECTPGEFHWPFTYDETVVVVKGRATVRLENGEMVELSPGDLAYFGRGQNSVWTIHENFRKAFHADSPDPLPF